MRLNNRFSAIGLWFSVATSVRSGCATACGNLATILPGQVTCPNSSTYNTSNTYWSLQQSSVTPSCYISPQSAQDVSIILLSLKSVSCQFAIRSGGHVPFAGASNIEGGATIDLVKLKQLSMSDNRVVTHVGAGNLWGDVYAYLEPRNLSVTGGRVAGIGVGGLTLGGGISFFSGRYGLACDNVLNYEVVFADGSINDVNASSFPDLYWALRGGGNNFGIVTRFDLFTFPQGDLWGGSLYWAKTANNTELLTTALADFTNNHGDDPYGAIIYSIAYIQSAAIWIIAADLEYGKPVINPPILQNFTRVPQLSLPGLKAGMAIANLTQLTLDLSALNPNGFRQTYWTISFKNSATLMLQIQDIFQEEITPIANISGLTPAVVLQPISGPMISHMSRNGGNALGISPAAGPLILMALSISWSSATDDEIVMAAASKTIKRAQVAAEKEGAEYRWIYQNYAAKEQRVFDGYGEASLGRLRKVSAKYDPEGVWEKLQPGYFKL